MAPAKITFTINGVNMAVLEAKVTRYLIGRLEMILTMEMQEMFVAFVVAEE